MSKPVRNTAKVICAAKAAEASIFANNSAAPITASITKRQRTDEFASEISSAYRLRSDIYPGTQSIIFPLGTNRTNRAGSCRLQGLGDKKLENSLQQDWTGTRTCPQLSHQPRGGLRRGNFWRFCRSGRRWRAVLLELAKEIFDEVALVHVKVPAVFRRVGHFGCGQHADNVPGRLYDLPCASGSRGAAGFGHAAFSSARLCPRL
jgi:hypothetical protein